MSQKIHAVQPRDSIPERSREASSRRPAKIRDFASAIEGKRKKRKARLRVNEDGQYRRPIMARRVVIRRGETKASKDMLLCGNGSSVC